MPGDREARASQLLGLRSGAGGAVSAEPVRPGACTLQQRSHCGQEPEQHALDSPALCSSRPSTAKKKRTKPASGKYGGGPPWWLPGKEPACQLRGRASHP